jgi:Bacterial cadherin-like domain/Protein of unknown function (DUF3060)
MSNTQIEALVAAVSAQFYGVPGVPAGQALVADGSSVILDPFFALTVTHVYENSFQGTPYYSGNSYYAQAMRFAQNHYVAEVFGLRNFDPLLVPASYDELALVKSSDLVAQPADLIGMALFLDPSQAFSSNNFGEDANLAGYVPADSSDQPATYTSLHGNISAGNSGANIFTSTNSTIHGMSGGPEWINIPDSFNSYIVGVNVGSSNAITGGGNQSFESNFLPADYYAIQNELATVDTVSYDKTAPYNLIVGSSNGSNNIRGTARRTSILGDSGGNNKLLAGQNGDIVNGGPGLNNEIFIPDNDSGATIVVTPGTETIVGGNPNDKLVLLADRLWNSTTGAPTSFTASDVSATIQLTGGYGSPAGDNLNGFISTGGTYSVTTQSAAASELFLGEGGSDNPLDWENNDYDYSVNYTMISGGDLEVQVYARDPSNSPDSVLWSSKILIKNYQPGDFGLSFSPSTDYGNYISGHISNAQYAADNEADNAAFFSTSESQSFVDDDKSIQWNGVFGMASPLPNPSAAALGADLKFLQHLDTGLPAAEVMSTGLTGPLADPESASTDENTPITVPFLVAASDAADTLSSAIISGPALGTVVANADNSFTFDPNGDFGTLASGSSEQVTFTYQTTDETDGLTSGVETVTITVEGISSGPDVDIETFLADQSALDSASGGFSVADAGANVAGLLDELNADTHLNSITLTGGGAPLVVLTCAETLNDTSALEKVTNANLGLIVADTFANIFANAEALREDENVLAIVVADTATNVLANLSAIADASWIEATTVSDSAANISANIDALNNDPLVGGITLTDSGTPTLTLTVEQALTDTTALGMISNLAYSVDVSDTASNVSSHIDELDGDTHIASITLIDDGAPTLTLTAEQTLEDAGALGAITNAFGVIVSDTAAHVSASIGALSDDPKIASITLTDGATPTLTLSVAELLDDSATLDKINNAPFDILVTDTAANILSNTTALAADVRVVSIAVVDTVANVLADSAALSADGLATQISVVDSAASVIVNLAALSGIMQIGSINLSDTSANISADLDALSDSEQITSISLTDTGTATLTLTASQALDDTAALGKIANPDYAIAVVDTAANIFENLDALSEDARVASFTLTDSGTPTLTLTIAQLFADAPALGEITNTDYGISISDTAANVSANIAALEDDALVASITLTDSGTPTLVLTADEALEDGAALATITNSDYAVAVSGSVDDIAANLDALSSDTLLASISLTNGYQMSLDVAQTLGDTTALGKVTNDNFSVVVSDTATNVLDNATALSADSQITSVTVVDTVANILDNVDALFANAQVAWITATGTVADVLDNASALIDDTWEVTITDTAANVVDNVSALGGFSTSALANDTQVDPIAVVDSAADVSTYLDALNDDAQVGSISLTDAGVPTLTLTVEQVFSDTTALGEITNPDAVFAISDSSANVSDSFDLLNSETQVSSITLTDGGTPVLTLSADQALNDGVAVGEISNSSYSILVRDSTTDILADIAALIADAHVSGILDSDSAVNISANIDELNSTALVTSITLTDSGTPVLRLSVAQALDDTEALGAISNSYGITISDTASEILDNTGALAADVRVTAITASDTAANILSHIDDLNGDSQITNIIVADTATAVAANFDALNAEAQINAITLTDSGVPTLTLSDAQVLSDTTALGKITNADYVVVVVDPATDVVDAATIYGVGGVISISSGAVNLLDDASAALNGSDNSIAIAGGDNLTLAGTDNTVTASGDGDYVLMEYDGNSVTMDNGYGTLWGGIAATVIGSADSVYVDSDDTLTITGTDGIVAVGGTDDTISISSGSVSTASGVDTTVSGSDNSVALAAGDNLTLAGTDNTVTASGDGDLVVMESAGDSATMDNGYGSVWGNVAAAFSGTGNSIYVDTGDTLTVTGSGNTVTAGGDGNAISISAGTISLIGANTTVSGDDNAITFSASNTVSVSGTGETYSFGAGGGQSEIGAVSGTNTGTVDFGSGLNGENLWFQQSGNNLQIDVMGTTNSLTIDDWFGGTNAAAVQGFATTDGLKLDTQVGQLVTAMATYAANNSGFNPTLVSQVPTDTTLQSAVAAAWHH